MNRSIVTHYQLPVIAKPSKGTFHFPPSFISTKWSSILRFLFPSIRSMRSNQFYSALFKSASQLIRICCFIINQTFYSFSRTTRSFPWYRYFIKRLFYQRDFRRGRRVQVVPQRNSLAVCHHHPLRTLSTFGFSDAEPPFLAGAKLPSANVSDHFNWPRSSNSERNALHAISQASRSSHSCSLRQQVDGEGYQGGRSFHRAPLRNTQRIPSKQRRSEILLRPFRFAVSCFSRKGAIFAHCLFVNSLLNRFAAIRESSFLLRTPRFQFKSVTGSLSSYINFDTQCLHVTNYEMASREICHR